ncbi:MAG: phosphatidate cytidylyltransferase [Smithellaceae bacterium]|nr:phosphatidate cytidylyltransferase [Smithellaceae bacterium]
MAGKNGNLQRWLTGLVLAVILLAIIFFGSVEILAAVIALAIVVAVWEYNSIVFGKGFLKEKIESMIFAALIPAVALAGSAEMMIAFLAFATMVVFMVFLWRVDESTFDLSSVLKVVFGMVYLPLLTSHFILLRKLEGGASWILLVLVIGIVGDTVAMYVGRALGKRKLIVLVSPGKTVEGTIGLILGATLAACAFGFFIFPEIALGHFFVLGFVGSIIGQLGDLSESVIKRNFGRKDASTLLPGHGGLMDRLDCLIFVAPFVYYYRIFVIG